MGSEPSASTRLNQSLGFSWFIHFAHAQGKLHKQYMHILYFTLLLQVQIKCSKNMETGYLSVIQTINTHKLKLSHEQAFSGVHTLFSQSWL